MSALLQYLHECDMLSVAQAVKGFRRLYLTVDDLALDTPTGATHTLSSHTLLAPKAHPLITYPLITYPLITYPLITHPPITHPLTGGAMSSECSASLSPDAASDSNYINLDQTISPYKTPDYDNAVRKIRNLQVNGALMNPTLAKLS